MMEKQIEEFLEFLRETKGYAANTIQAYRNDLKQFLNFSHSDRPHLTHWGRVDKILLHSYLTHLKKHNYAAASISRKVAVIKSFYHFLLEKNFVSADPTTSLNPPRVEKKAPQILSSEQIERLLAQPILVSTPKAYRDHAILAVLYGTGLRVSELVGLDLDDANLEANTIHCLARNGAARIIPMSEQTALALSNYVRNGRSYFTNSSEQLALFVNPRGERLTRQGLWLIIKECVRAAAISLPVTPHTLRHSFAVHQLSRGEELASVQKILGHTNIATTQFYRRIAERAGQNNGSGQIG